MSLKCIIMGLPLIQLIFPSDHSPESVQVRDEFPEIMKPLLHVWLATAPNTVIENDTLPFSGTSGGPQSTTAVFDYYVITQQQSI